MGLNGDVDIQVARWAAVAPRFALASQTDPVAVVDAGRHLDRSRLVLAYAAAAAALAARLLDRGAGAAAARARLLNREETLCDTNVPDAVARFAGNRL